jgi:hypothetical protein
MLKRILIAPVALVAGFFAIGYVLPAEQVVARSVAVKAAPADIYAQVANLKKWGAWAPWGGSKFAGAQVSYEGPETGVGAVMVWQGKENEGGKLWVTQGDPLSGISYEMWMRGDQRKSTGGIQLVPNELETLVVWTWRARFEGPLERWMGLAVDEMLGPQIEAGLIELKKVVEASGAVEFAEPVAVTPPSAADESVRPAVPSSDEARENPEQQAAEAESERDTAPIAQGEPNEAQGGGEAASEDPKSPVAPPTQ